MEGEDSSSDRHVGSPTHIAMTGHDLSAEEIQDLLGVMDGSASATSASDTTDVPQWPMQSNITIQARDQARTERKRCREKQRRVDVNNQFNQLTHTLREMENKHALQGPPVASSNRADLIGRTIALIQELDARIEKQKAENIDVNEQLRMAKQAGEEAAAKLKDSLMAPQPMGQNVMMMVPMMIPGDQAKMMSSMMPGAATATSSAGAQATNTAQTATPTNAGAQGNAAAGPVMMMPQMMPQMMQGMVMPQMMASAPSQFYVPQSAATSDSKANASNASSTVAKSNLAHCA